MTTTRDRNSGSRSSSSGFRKFWKGTDSQNASTESLQFKLPPISDESASSSVTMDPTTNSLPATSSSLTLKFSSPGYALSRFPSPPQDHFICVICHNVLCTPMQTPCGHVFCDYCIGSLLASQSMKCPLCARSIAPAQLTQAPVMVMNMINGLKITCVYERNGCGAQDITVGTVLEHEKECVFAPAVCLYAECPKSQPIMINEPTPTTDNVNSSSNSNGDSRSALRKIDLDKHLAECEWRVLPCMNCDQTLTAKDLEFHTNFLCENASVSCEHGCGMFMKRNEINEHQMNVCLNFTISCQVPGCEFQAERGATEIWNNHATENVGSHLMMTMRMMSVMNETTLQLQNTIGKLKYVAKQQDQRISLLEEKCHILQLSKDLASPYSVEWVLTDVTRKFAAQTFEYSPELCFDHVPIPALRYSFKFCVQLNMDDSQGTIGIFFSPQRGVNYQGLKWPIENQIQLEVVNVRGGANRGKNLEGSGSKAWFAKVNIPPEEHSECRGWRLLTANDVESGTFLENDSIVLRATLLEKPM